MKKYWTHGDKTGASEAKNAEWKKKCEESFRNIGFKRKENVELEQYICKEPYWKMSSRVPPNFEYISKDYRDYKKDPKQTPNNLKKLFEQFDENKDGEQSQSKTAQQIYDEAMAASELFNTPQPSKTGQKVVDEAITAYKKLDAQTILWLRTKATEAERLRTLSDLTKEQLNQLLRLQIKSKLLQTALTKDVQTALKLYEGGRKSRRKQRRNRKTRRFF